MRAADLLRAEDLVARLRSRGLRFVTVSISSTLLTLALVWWFVGALGWAGGRANFVAVCVSSVPSYLATRHWVWGMVRGNHSFRGEVLPYWGMSLLGLALSTVLAWLAYRVYPQAWAVSAANIAGFGALWVVRFLVFDRYLFRPVERVPLRA